MAIPPPAGVERRRTPRRRLRDRIASLDRTHNPTLAARRQLADLVLLVEDDLRQTALALGGVERFLVRSLELLEKAGVTAAELGDHADDDQVLRQLDELSQNVANLRRRMSLVASSLK
jgi:hypothetical protein